MESRKVTNRPCSDLNFRSVTKAKIPVRTPSPAKDMTGKIHHAANRCTPKKSLGVGSPSILANSRPLGGPASSQLTVSQSALLSATIPSETDQELVTLRKDNRSSSLSLRKPAPNVTKALVEGAGSWNVAVCKAACAIAAPCECAITIVARHRLRSQRRSIRIRLAIELPRSALVTK